MILGISIYCAFVGLIGFNVVFWLPIYGRKTVPSIGSVIKLLSNYTPPNVLLEQLIVAQLVENFLSSVELQGRVQSFLLDPFWVGWFQATFLCLILRSILTVFGIVTRLWAGSPEESRFDFQQRGKRFFSPPKSADWLWGPPTLISRGKELFHRW
jgi:hypothetical protein